MSRIVIASVLSCAASVSQAQVDFSHDFGTAGLPGTGVNASPNPGEVFTGNGAGSNTLTANLASMGLVFGDNIDAFDRGDVISTQSGVSAFPFLFSVEPGAIGQMPFPVWAQAPFNAADIYALQSGATGHVQAYNEPGIGLRTVPVESIDAMTDPMVSAGQRVYFSLQQGSPTLLANAWSGADLLTVVIGAPASLRRAASANDLGLIPADELDGVAMFGRMDVNGNGVFDAPGDSALVYFSVDETSVGVPGSDVRNRSLTSFHHGGDIYLSGLAGGHTLLHEGDRRIRLAAGDVLDALKLGSTDPLDPFPMYIPGFPNPGDEPEKPANCPPYRGGGAPIGTFWVEVCDADVPSIVNWSIEIKMCDANGNTMTIRKDGQVRGMASSDPNVKAQLIKDAFESMEFDKPGQDPDSVPLFKGLAKNVPPVNVARPGISGEVCGFVNQDVIDCGWNVDAICFSFSNWTAQIVVKPVKGWFPDVVRRPIISAQGIPETDGLLRISSANGFGDTAIDVIYAAPLNPGEPAEFAMNQITNQINDDGGFASFDGIAMTVYRLPLEPPTAPDGLSGPLVWESGALNNPGVQVTVGATLARGPGSPCTAVDYAEPYGELNFFDVSAFLAAFTDQSGQADLAYDGEFNFFDVSVFLQLYAQGCPKEDFGG